MPSAFATNVEFIFATDNESCNNFELEQLFIYSEITRKLLTNYGYAGIMNSQCGPVAEISLSTFPFLLMEFGIEQPDLLIVIGDVEVNEKMVIQDEAYGVWACVGIELKYGEPEKCSSHVIVVCNDCENERLQK